jgi:hypothetical protein
MFRMLETGRIGNGKGHDCEMFKGSESSVRVYALKHAVQCRSRCFSNDRNGRN